MLWESPARVAQEREPSAGKCSPRDGCWGGGREPRTDSTNTAQAGVKQKPPQHGLVPELRAKCGGADARLGLPAVEDSHQGSLATGLSFPVLIVLHTLTHK